MAMVKRASKAAKSSKPGKGEKNLPPWLMKKAPAKGSKGGKAPRRGKKSKVIAKD